MLWHLLAHTEPIEEEEKGKGRKEKGEEPPESVSPPPEPGETSQTTMMAA